MRGDTSSSPFKKLQQQIRIQRCQLPTAPPYTSQNSASLQHIPGNRLSSFALESFSLSFTVFLTNSNTVGSFELASTTQLYNPTRLFTKKKLPKVYPPGSSNTCWCPVTQRLVLRGWSTKGCPGQAWRSKPHTARSQHGQEVAEQGPGTVCANVSRKDKEEQPEEQRPWQKQAGTSGTKSPEYSRGEREAEHTLATHVQMYHVTGCELCSMRLCEEAASFATKVREISGKKQWN